MATKRDRERDESIKALREWIQPGDTIYGIVRHVSSSGMSRRIDFYKLEHESKRGESRPMYLTYHVARVLGYTLRDREVGMRVGGCGMDMVFACVSHLSSTLFREHTLTKRDIARMTKRNMEHLANKSHGYYLRSEVL